LSAIALNILQVVYESDVSENAQKPSWPEIELTLKELTGGDVLAPIMLQIWDLEDKFQRESMLGYVTVCINQLSESCLLPLCLCSESERVGIPRAHEDKAFLRIQNFQVLLLHLSVCLLPEARV
jgi:hypothetical protein